MNTVFQFYVNEIGAWIQWLFSWNLYGVPCLYYFMGIIMLGLLLDFIFG